MAGYRPITDLWFLARCKYKNGVKRYGGYLGGFPERARVLLGVSLDKPLLHACGGMARHYPYKRGFGPEDCTADIDPKCMPDFVWDLDCSFPSNNPGGKGMDLWPGVLIDPPYSDVDAEKYDHKKCPSLNNLVKNALAVVGIGGKVGVIHYSLPAQPKNAKFVAAIGICCGFNNRIRVFSVFERES